MSDDDSYTIPPQACKPFGAGIKRQRVKFVPSSTPSTFPLLSGSTGQSVSDLYLKMVLPADQKNALSANKPDPDAIRSSLDSFLQEEICEICKFPLSEESPPAAPRVPHTEQIPTPRQTPHEASLAHQVCLAHSHPPSHLDRNRKGLSYLSAYGWDPDSRLGLGASGQGIQFPIKAKVKDDKIGLGVVLPKVKDRKNREKIVKLDAGKVRKMYEKDKKKAERLREMFYRNDDVERYLGGG
ncbi:G-patch domain protein [Diplocarpon rosae]|nr:G-patch domain protein [Diplocarpon rosae]